MVNRLVRELVGELDFSFAADTPNLVTVTTGDSVRKNGSKGPVPGR